MGAPMTIVPRWEWRTFGAHFGEAESRFAALTPDRVEDSDEGYLLSLGSHASVKLRDGLMDVKLLERVDENGLEQWRPELKAPDPLTSDQVAEVLKAVGIPQQQLRRMEYTLQQFRDELVVPHPELMVARVHKRRARYTLDGCMAELTEIQTGGHSTRTIAIESEDPSLVSAVVNGLGLASRANVCMARGLKSLIGFGAKRFAVIDIGTNSLKFHIGERNADGAWTTVVDRAVVTRLGEAMDASGSLQKEPIARSVDAIAAMVDEARAFGVEAIAAVGTAGLRIAPNRAVLIDAVRERTGQDVEVISGEEEARLAYMATTSALDVRTGTLAVFDTGGGSSQFTFGRDGQIREQFSVNVGSVGFTERFGLHGPVTEERLDEAMAAIAAELVKLEGPEAPGGVVGMGGAVTNLAAVSHGLTSYDASVIHGTVLRRDEIDRQIELYRTASADQRREIVGLQPNRAEVILAGACIVRTILTSLDHESFTVSDRGLRHRLIVERFG